MCSPFIYSKSDIDKAVGLELAKQTAVYTKTVEAFRAEIDAKDAEIMQLNLEAAEGRTCMDRDEKRIAALELELAEEQQVRSMAKGEALRLRDERNKARRELAETREWQERVDNSEWPSNWEFIVAKHEDELAEAKKDPARLDTALKFLLDTLEIVWPDDPVLWFEKVGELCARGRGFFSAIDEAQDELEEEAAIDEAGEELEEEV